VREARSIGPGGQGCRSDGAEEIDLQLDGRERLALSQRGGVGVPHRRISQVAVGAAVQRPHRVVVALVGLHLKDRMAGFDGLQAESEQAGDRRQGCFAPQHFLTLLEHGGHVSCLRWTGQVASPAISTGAIPSPTS
jgi:hypothetical protein